MTDAELVRLAAEKVMRWTRPVEILPKDASWSLPERGGPWELRVYADPAPPLGEDWPFMVTEKISEEEFASRFYWKNPEGKYVHPECGFDDPPDWNPLINDQDCWGMVERLRERGWGIRVALHTGHLKGTSVRVYRYEPFVEFRIDEAEDRRRAIVLACLRAVGVEV